MANLGTALAIVLGINVMLWLGQVAVFALVPAGSINELNTITPAFYNCKDKNKYQTYISINSNIKN